MSKLMWKFIFRLKFQVSVWVVNLSWHQVPNQVETSYSGLNVNFQLKSNNVLSNFNSKFEFKF